jgi:hypothetical protein
MAQEGGQPGCGDDRLLRLRRGTGMLLVTKADSKRTKGYILFGHPWRGQPRGD